MNKFVKIQYNGRDVIQSNQSHSPGYPIKVFNSHTDQEIISEINRNILSGQCRDYYVGRRIDPTSVVKVIRGSDYINIVTKEGVQEENSKEYWQAVERRRKQRNEWFRSQPRKIQNTYCNLAALITGEKAEYKHKRSFWQWIKRLFISESQIDPFEEIAKEVCKMKRKADLGWANSEKISIGDMVKNHGRKSK